VVVYLLEVVQVNHHHGKRAAVDRSVLERALQAPLQLATVEQSGQRIVTRLVRPLARLPVRGGYIGNRALVIQRRTAAVAH